MYNFRPFPPCVLRQMPWNLSGRTDGQTDGRTDGHAVKRLRLVGWTNGPMYRSKEGISGFGRTDGRTDGRTTRKHNASAFKLSKVANFHWQNCTWKLSCVILLTFCSGTEEVTHWGRDEMKKISQTTFSNVFSSMKMFEFRLKFHWSLFPRVDLIILQHWFR